MNGSGAPETESADKAMTRAVTAGAFIRFRDRYLFGLGPAPEGDRLAVYRLGGHIEAGETPWEALVREVREESTLTAKPVEPPATIWVRRDEENAPLTMLDGAWPRGQGPRPLALVVAGGEPAAPLNVMFLVRAEGQPQPANEVRGLLLLRRQEVIALSRAPMTLAEFQRAGGQALLAGPLDGNLPLAPFLQPRLLARLMLERPELLEDFDD